MTSPGPDAAQLDAILSAATRVPDHGKLTPWRFIVFEGDARTAFGGHLARLFREANPAAIDELVEAERKRFLRAPVVVAVISRALGNAKVPEWEQILSAGAACMNLLTATHAHGLAGSWLTEWYAYDERVRPLLKLEAHERVAGFVYLGTPAVPLEDRPRPDLSAIVQRWSEG
jgi:nitroreductase